MAQFLFWFVCILVRHFLRAWIFLTELFRFCCFWSWFLGDYHMGAILKSGCQQQRSFTQNCIGCPRLMPSISFQVKLVVTPGRSLNPLRSRNLSMGTYSLGRNGWSSSLTMVAQVRYLKLPSDRTCSSIIAIRFMPNPRLRYVG